MKLYSLLIFLIFCSFLGAAQSQQYKKLRVYLDGRPTAALMQTGITCDHGIHKKQVYFESDFSVSDIHLLDQHGFRYDILIEDVVQYYQEQNDEKSLLNNHCDNNSTDAYPQPQNFVLGSMGGFLTYQQMLDNLDSMVAKYPNLITPKTIIDPANLTHENRPIYWLRISDNPNIDEPSEPQALYNAIHHAREPLAMSQLIYFMWYLLENYNSDPEIKYLVDQTALYFIPCLNPDGYIYNETTNPNGGGMWRKNRRNNGSNFGVDLNRNYGYAFAYDNVGSSGNTNSDTYRGPSAFSEPETQNLRDFCLGHNFQFSMNYHTYGAQLIYPWAYNDQLTPDSAFFINYAKVMTRENNYEYGTNMETIGYSTNGDADDWLYGEQTQKNKILSLTPEASTGGFWPPSSSIVGHCKGTMWQNLAVAHLLLDYGVATETGDQMIAQNNAQIYFDIARFGMQASTLTLSLNPISNNITGVGAPKQFNLNQFQQISDSLSIQIDPATNNGASIIFVMELNNGQYLQRDTIRKIFGSFNSLVSDDASTLNNWTNASNSNWEVTTSDFYSPNSSITDSRNGNYSNQANRQLLLNQVLDLSGVTDASIEFWAKWNIEADYDYVQLMASTDNSNYVPLCGLYTNDGTSDQDLNQPLYDGQQSSWIKEFVSLQDFIGSPTVYLKFRLISDFWLNEDGFYFDDFKVNVISAPLSAQEVDFSEENLGQNIPNPAHLKVCIPIQGPVAPLTRLEVMDIYGRIVFSNELDEQAQQMTLDVEKWTDGIYFYRLSHNNQYSQTYKMIICH